ncbi:MAG: hypothetical protein AB1500_04030 [Bacillota bacterium]
MSEKTIIDSEGTEKYIEKFLAPVTDAANAAEMLRGRLGTYPFYALFLYSEVDEDIAEFVRVKGSWLHSLTGSDCLVGVLENPGEWGEGWERHWRQRLGEDYDKVSAEWLKLKPFDRNTAFSLAELLEVEKNTLPCIVFMESFEDNKILCIPLVADKAGYPKYFMDVFAAIGHAVDAPPGERLQALRSEWRKVWAKWILPEKIKHLTKVLQEWGSILKETKEALINAVEPLTPLLRNVKNALVPGEK